MNQLVANHKVQIVMMDVFCGRIVDELCSISNIELARKIKGWAYKSPGSATWLTVQRVAMESYDGPFWEQNLDGVIPMLAEKFRFLMGREIPPILLISQVNGLVTPPYHTLLQVVLRVSQPGIVRALVLDSFEASRLKDRYDIELGKRR